MDPLSLTASILTVVGISAQSTKLLKSAIALKDAPRLISDLDQEFSSLRRDVFAIWDLFRRQSKDLTSRIDYSLLGDEILASVVGCLEQAYALVKELERSLTSLLMLLVSDTNTIKKLIKWMREERRLKELKESLYNVRIKLNTTLGLLDW